MSTRSVTVIANPSSGRSKGGRPVPQLADGELAGTLPPTFTIDRRALAVVVPGASDERAGG